MSCLFYMAFIPVYILVLFTTILIDYTAGIYIERSVGKQKRLWLIGSIASTCLVLFVFKYFNFFSANLEALARLLHWNYPIASLALILPIGLSFHTFQSLAYVIEVYRGRQKAENSFGLYALYVMFFPQLVAGPIERPQNLIHQFYEKHSFDYRRVTDGLKLMTWGMFKKVVIADRLALFVNTVYEKPTEYQGISLLLATVFFSFQIYCDFSGYSDIAIGAAQVLGFKLMDNFNRPYYAKSIAEFWRRWHISLSTWFKDYLYISLGGNRVSVPRWYCNLFITFLVSGLWHGANWIYVVWGAIHGSYMIIGIMTADLRKRLVAVLRLHQWPRFYKFLQIYITFNLVSFAWIFFRARNIDEALYIVTHLFSGVGTYLQSLWTSHNPLADSAVADPIFLGLPKVEFWIAVGVIGLMEYIHLVQRHASMRHILQGKPAWLRWGIYYSALLAIIFLGMFEDRKFIYFQF